MARHGRTLITPFDLDYRQLLRSGVKEPSVESGTRGIWTWFYGERSNRTTSPLPYRTVYTLMPPSHLTMFRGTLTWWIITFAQSYSVVLLGDVIPNTRRKMSFSFTPWLYDSLNSLNSISVSIVYYLSPNFRSGSTKVTSSHVTKRHVSPW